MKDEHEKSSKEDKNKREAYEKPKITKYSRKRRITSVAGASSTAITAVDSLA